jgi:hypothetical protein
MRKEKQKVSDKWIGVCVFINIYPYVLRFYWPIPEATFARLVYKFPGYTPSNPFGSPTEQNMLF